MGKSQRDKGNRAERELVNDLKDRGIFARRVPLSGATQHDPDDVVIETALSELRVEVKRRAKPLSKALEDALGGADMVATRADRGEWRWYVPHGVMVRLLAALKKSEATEKGVQEMRSRLEDYMKDWPRSMPGSWGTER